MHNQIVHTGNILFGKHDVFNVLNKLGIGCFSQKITDNIFHDADSCNNYNNSNNNTHDSVCTLEWGKGGNQQCNNCCGGCDAVVQTVLLNCFHIYIVCYSEKLSVKKRHPELYCNGNQKNNKRKNAEFNLFGIYYFFNAAFSEFKAHKEYEKGNNQCAYIFHSAVAERMIVIHRLAGKLCSENGYHI